MTAGRSLARETPSGERKPHGPTTPMARAHRQEAVCRWCYTPIRRALGAWIHDVPHGAFYCRDRETGMFLSTPAEPQPVPDGVERAVGRHTAGVARDTDAQRATGRYPVTYPDSTFPDAGRVLNGAL